MFCKGRAVVPHSAARRKSRRPSTPAVSITTSPPPAVSGWGETLQHQSEYPRSNVASWTDKQIKSKNKPKKRFLMTMLKLTLDRLHFRVLSCTNIVGRVVGLYFQSGSQTGQLSLWCTEICDGSEAAARHTDGPVFGLRQR